eukprot:2735362-Pleurochrysis_carterae.AAC.1
MRCYRGVGALRGTPGCSRIMLAWSRSSRRSAPPGGWTGRGSTRQSSSSVSTRWDRLAVVSLGPLRRGGS